ncbi:putative bifunctional diguanylate cyclase/phosphodiesterase [Demequina sp. SO4-18]|uniref:putative bifunctional diguanylate cyclase/phosphodiesterase n=1 Tax=Demequina sp. SO4-18 TaxID=3401026 RepID=UPI003B5BAB6E
MSHPARPVDPRVNGQRLVAAAADLSHMAAGEFTGDAMLRALAQVATESMDVDGAGVLRRAHDRNVFAYSHGAYAMGVRSMEQLQEGLQAGPGADAIASGSVIASEDLGTDERWVDLQRSARQLKIRSVLAVPLISRGQAWGVLDLYCQQARTWSAEDVQAARALADVAVSYLVMASDRDLARSAHKALSYRAMHDDLTGLPNRTLLLDRMEQALGAADRSGAGVAAVFLDLDLFKDVNDTFGHFTADTVLVEIARRLSATLRAGDTLARFAGDEFVIVCSGLSHESHDELGRRVDALTTRLQRTMQAPIRVGDVEVVVSASIGAAIATASTTAQELIANADFAMYSAKKSGPGRVMVRDRFPEGEIADVHHLEHRLIGALERGELRVHYQPIVSADTQRVAAAEALLRWDQPGHGMVPADVFIDIAVRKGLIVEIGRWVIAQACQDLAAWSRDLAEDAPDTVYINLSARELADDALLHTIDRALADTGLSPCQVGFEIVEDDLADLAAINRLADLQRRGHPLSIDDFGTGYSSLARLLDLPATMAKLDRSIVQGIPADERRLRFIEGVLRVAGTLDLKVIAEGVETSEQAEHLARVGCPLLQGYYFARPQSASDLTALWAPKPAPVL